MFCGGCHDNALVRRETEQLVGEEVWGNSRERKREFSFGNGGCGGINIYIEWGNEESCCKMNYGDVKIWFSGGRERESGDKRGNSGWILERDWWQSSKKNGIFFFYRIL